MRMTNVMIAAVVVVQTQGGFGCFGFRKSRRWLESRRREEDSSRSKTAAAVAVGELGWGLVPRNPIKLSTCDKAVTADNHRRKQQTLPEFHALNYVFTFATRIQQQQQRRRQAIVSRRCMGFIVCYVVQTQQNIFRLTDLAVSLSLSDTTHTDFCCCSVAAAIIIRSNKPR